MKKIINIVILACLTLFISCEKETEGISFETNYANFTMTGPSFYNLPLGTPYAEPGLKAEAGGQELPVTATNNIDHTKMGIYDVNYSATNKDGYGATTSRMVAVYDPAAPATDLTGNYISDMYRLNADGVSGRRTFTGLAVTVTKVSPGIFYVSDLLGGYYDQGVKYGAAYAMTGYVALKADNTLVLLRSHVSAWGDSLEKMQNGKYDPVTGTITFSSYYASGRSFNVTLKK